MMATESEVEVYHKHAFAEYSVNVLEPSIDVVDQVYDCTEFSVEPELSGAPSVLNQGMFIASASECSEPGSFDLGALFAKGESPSAH